MLHNFQVSLENKGDQNQFWTCCFEQLKQNFQHFHVFN